MKDDVWIADDLLPDLLKQGARDLVRDFLKVLREIIGSGKRIVICKVVIGLPPQNLAVLSTQNALDDYEQKLEELSKII